MDAKLQVKRFIILGESGFIGSTLFRALCETNEIVVGINRYNLKISKNGKLHEQPRKEKEIYLELKPFLSQETTIINTIWGKLERKSRNSIRHEQCALKEIEIIKKLEGKGYRYISFGSVAEVDDEDISPSYGTSYANAKAQVAAHLLDSDLYSIWVRVAAAYGPSDNRDWFMTQLIKRRRNLLNLRIENPSQLINLCHKDSLVQKVIWLSQNNLEGTINIATRQWVTIGEIRDSFENLVEPRYTTRLSGPFSNSDPAAIYIDTPPITNYFKLVKSSYKS